MINEEYDHSTPLKDRLGAFIHHRLVSIAVVTLILISVALVMAYLTLDADHPAQDPIELAQIVITVFFVFELGTNTTSPRTRAATSPSTGSTSSRSSPGPRASVSCGCSACCACSGWR